MGLGSSCLGTSILAYALIPPPTYTVSVDTIYFLGFPLIRENRRSNYELQHFIREAGLGLAIMLQPLIAAMGIREAAKEIDPDGSIGISCLWGYLGVLVGGGFGLSGGYIIDKAFHNGNFYWSALPLAFLGSNIGAVIGYNLSLPKGYSYRHFDLPSFTMKTEKTQEGKTITALDFRLINARF